MSTEHPRRVSVFTIRSNGSDPRRIVTGFVRAPEYSPDGKRIAFEGQPKGTRANAYGIWTVKPNGSHLRRLTDPGNRFSDQYPDWSPDGRHIAFERCDVNSTHGCDGTVYLVRADGTNERPIRAISGDNPPAFSPTGNRIALTAYLTEDVCSDLDTMSLTGVTHPYITHNCDDLPGGGGGFAAQPTWQPIPPP